MRVYRGSLMLVSLEDNITRDKCAYSWIADFFTFFASSLSCSRYPWLVSFC